MPAHNTISCATNAHSPKYMHHRLYNMHGGGAVLSPVSIQDTIQQRTEQVVDALDNKLTVSLCAVACHSERKHKETRQATLVQSKELIDKVQNEMVQLMEDELLE